MDIDNSCDSDISESWSLVDLNDNEHGNETNFSILHDTNLNINGPTTGVRNASSSNSMCKSSTENFFQQSEEIEKNSANFENSFTETSNVSAFHEHSKDQQDFKILHKGKIFQNNYDVENKSFDINNYSKTVNEEEKIDLENKFKDIDNDTDCISVISESECNEVKFSAYETDEIWEDKLSGENMLKSHPNALKRKRKRLKLNYRESSEESISSDFMFPDEKYYGNFQSSDAKRSVNEMQVKEYQNNPVYRHYRNNVANTMLTLAMGIIFAGVACIALGHFLGVHDAQQTAGEMMQTLKRLQMENILLQTRLTQLSRAFFNRGNNKLEFKMNVESQNCLKRYFNDEKNIYGDSEDKLHKTARTENSPFLPVGTLNILGELKNPLVETFVANSHSLDSNKLVKYVRDQKNFLNLSRYNIEFSKEPFSRISLKPYEVQENILISRSTENSKKPVINYNYKLNQQFDQPFVDDDDYYNNNYVRHINSNFYKQNCLAVRENELSKFRWYLIKEKKNRKKDKNGESDKLNSSVMLYKFPQPEAYYMYEGLNQKIINDEKKNLDVSTHERFNRKLKQKVLRDGYQFLPSASINNPEADIHMSKFLNSTDNSSKKNIEDLKFKNNFENEKREKKNIETEKKKTKNLYSSSKRKDLTKTCKNLNIKEAKTFTKYLKKFNKNLWKVMKKLCKNNAAKKVSKAKRYNSKTDYKVDFSVEDSKWKDKHSDQEYMNSNNRPNFLRKGTLDNVAKKNSSKNRRNLKNKDKIKKKECLYFFSNNNNIKKVKKNVMADVKWINQTESANILFGNNYAKWLYKWATGREKSRRNQKVTNWQFYRARSRESLRRGDAMWQFSRAFAREFIRNDDHKNYERKSFKYSQM